MKPVRHHTIVEWQHNVYTCSTLHHTRFWQLGNHQDCFGLVVLVVVLGCLVERTVVALGCWVEHNIGLVTHSDVERTRKPKIR